MIFGREPATIFQSTLPLRGATLMQSSKRAHWTFQSTLPLRGATINGSHHGAVPKISIHAPLAGSDWQSKPPLMLVLHFNPRSPCGERRERAGKKMIVSDFNPRSPCGERRILFVGLDDPLNFNPRSPCGERPGGVRTWSLSG